MLQKSEIKSLVSLLDDPDPYVQGAVKQRLFELGERAVPLLDEQRNAVSNEHERELINDIIRDITFGSVEEDFVDILEGGLNTLEQLEKAVFVLSRFGNPTLRLKEYERKLDHFANTIRDKILYQPSESKQMHTLLQFVFQKLDFKGGNTDYYHPQNAYLDRVIDRRRGLPISLAFIVLFLARRLDLPFHGVNMPIHFLLKFKGEKEELLIDPFDNGKTITYNQCYYFLQQNGVDPKSAHFEEPAEAAMLARLIGNLMRSYRRMEQDQKADNLQALLQTLEMMCL
jgi:regulator of sirC expression with transglutaminase-like and TPR domain